MIGWLSGKIIDKSQPGKLVLDVNGVGYDIETSLQTFWQINDLVTISLHIHTVVREDALLLYGFISKQERLLFRALIRINGIGPKIAINILSTVTPNEFIQAVIEQNLAVLIKLPGIGKKTGERLLVEMKDNIQQLLQGEEPLSAVAPKFQEQNEAISALTGLGYKLQEATKIIKKIDDGNKTCEQLIRIALQSMAGNRGVTI